jgi:hypothetical protein
MLNEFRHDCQPHWDIEKIRRCCPEPPHPHPEPPCNPDCCYDTWNWELKDVNLQLKVVTKELTDTQKHLEVLTTRYKRLKGWREELMDTNELVVQICFQLQLIEGLLGTICENTCFTVKAVKTLYCMIREFYYTIDQLQEKYDRIMNCIKCLNLPALTTTSGIGQVLSNYGTALTAVIQTRTALVTLLMQVVESSIQLYEQICDECGYQRLIHDCLEGLHCGIPCIKEEHHHEGQGHGPVLPLPLPNPPAPGGPPDVPGVFCLAPMLTFPICNDQYTLLITHLFDEEAKEVHLFTEEVNKLSKRQQALLAVQASLQKALKEVTPASATTTA